MRAGSESIVSLEIAVERLDRRQEAAELGGRTFILAVDRGRSSSQERAALAVDNGVAPLRESRARALLGGLGGAR